MFALLLACQPSYAYLSQSDRQPFAKDMPQAAKTSPGTQANVMLDQYLIQYPVLVKHLLADHIQIILHGDQLKFIVPADRLFRHNTQKLTSRYNVIIKEMATLLKGLNIYGVKVAAYTDNTYEASTNLAVSSVQARLIAHDLWELGLNTPLLYARGYGERHPIGSNMTKIGRARNKRIEITLQVVFANIDC